MRALLEQLAQGLRSAAQARRELRWLQQEQKNGVLGPERLTLAQAVARRAQGYPLQYILGTQPFGRLSIQCRPGALVPRWETEEWALKLAAQLHATPGARVLDLCTGTGCVLFALLDENAAMTGAGVDASPRALEVFELNRRGLPHVAARSRAQLHDVRAALPPALRACDVVVANPPYIARLADADAGVVAHEPRLALVEPPGIYESLVDRVLETDATRAVFEVGSAMQIERCVALFARRGWAVRGEKDGAGRWRTVWAAAKAAAQTTG